MATAAVMIEVPPAKSKLQQSIKDSTAALIAQLKAGKSEALTTYLEAMAKFHSYSFCNQLLIAQQKPAASKVAGFHKWLSMGRYVRKGEKGIGIFAPMVKKSKDEAEPETKGPRLIGFRIVYVFDVSQTEGEPLPEADFYCVTGDAADRTAKLIKHIESTGFTVVYDASIAPAFGSCSPSKISLLPGQSSADEFATLVHEYAHHLLHQGDRRPQTNKTTRETEAEAAAFIVATACGLDFGRAAADYIQLYDGNAETLIASLHAVQEASHTILDAVEV